MPENADDVQVTQSLTTVLGAMDRRIDQGFSEVKQLVADKATKRDLEHLSDTVSKGLADHEKRLTALEDDRRDRVSARRWILTAGKVGGSVLGTAGVLAGIIYTIAYIAHG